MLDILKSMNHPAHNLFNSTLNKSSTYDTKIVLLFQVHYLAESTIYRYKVPPQPSQGYIPVVTRIHPTTKVENSSDAE